MPIPSCILGEAAPSFAFLCARHPLTSVSSVVQNRFSFIIFYLLLLPIYYLLFTALTYLLFTAFSAYSAYSALSTLQKNVR